MSTQTTFKTQVATIKAHLLTGKRIDTWQAYSTYGITCLAQRVHDLRKAGVSVEGEMVTQNAKRFKRYWIDTPAHNDSFGGLKP